MATLEPEPELQPFEPVDPSPPFRWRYGLALVAASLLGSALLIPYSHALLVQSKDLGVPRELLPVVLVIGALVEGVMSVVAVVLGLGLGERIGLVWPPLIGWGAGPEGRRSRRSALLLATGLGLGLGIVLTGISFLTADLAPPKAANLKNPDWLAGLLASAGAGVREEVWLRFGLLTLFARLGVLMTRRQALTSGVFWTANLLAALLFGALHLPQAAQLLGLTPYVLTVVFVGNGVPGLVFGWLYRRKGLLAAMASHFALDVVLKVFAPLIDL